MREAGRDRSTPFASCPPSCRSSRPGSCPGLRPKHAPRTPVDRLRVGCGRGAARAEDAQGTPTQSHVPPSILVYEDKRERERCFIEVQVMSWDCRETQN